MGIAGSTIATGCIPFVAGFVLRASHMFHDEGSQYITILHILHAYMYIYIYIVVEWIHAGLIDFETLISVFLGIVSGLGMPGKSC